MQKDYLVKTIIAITLFLLTIFICMQSSFAPSGSYLANPDSAIYKQIGFSISNGQIPYKDTYDNKGPIFYYLVALGEIIDGTYGIFIVECILMFVATIFCYKTAKLFTNPIIAICSTIIVFSGLNEIFWHGNMTEEYVLPFTFIAMYFFIKYLLNKEVRPINIILIGMCFATTILIRANLIAIYIGFIIVIFIEMLLKKQIKELFKAMGCFIIGVIIIFIPMILYLYCNNALAECIKQVYIGPSSYFNESEIIEKIKLLHSLLSNLSNFGYIFIVFYIFYVGYLYFNNKNNKFKLIHLSMILSLIVNMYLATMSNANFSHYTMSFIPLLIIPTLTILDLISVNFKNIDNIVTIVFLTILISWNSINMCINNIFDNVIGKYDQSFYEEINRLTEKTDKIYIFDGYTQMYHTKRLSASKYLYLPIIYNIPTEEKIEALDELLEDLKINMPKIILISDESYENYTNLSYYNFEKYLEFFEQNYDVKEKIFQYNLYVLKD